MVSNILYKLSAFSDYSMLSYNSIDVIAIMTAFNDISLVPQNLKEIGPGGVITSRMIFEANDGQITIAITSTRIDIQITSNVKEGFTAERIEEIKHSLLSYLEKVFFVFKEKVSLPYRIAWYTSYIYFELTPEEKELFRNRFVKEQEFFKQNPLEDMIVRYGAQRSATINEKQERINVITTIGKYWASMGQDDEVDGYQIEYDINTWQGNRVNRFHESSIKAFVDCAYELQRQLNEEFLP